MRSFVVFLAEAEASAIAEAFADKDRALVIIPVDSVIRLIGVRIPNAFHARRAEVLTNLRLCVSSRV